MARSRKQAAAELVNGSETLVLWKAKGPLSEHEHEQLSNKARFEQEKSGVKIVLVPYSVDVEVVTQEQPNTPPNPDQEKSEPKDQEDDKEPGNSGDDQ